MKKQIVTAMAVMTLAAGFAAGVNGNEAEAAKKISINKKNFPDQIFREMVKANYDKNKDKKLSAGEIKKAKKFGTSSCKTVIKIKKSKYGKYEKKYVSDIKNFKGIEKLTNLQKFVANGTSVKTVNFKKNKNLTYLEMTDGNLTKLDLNKNKKLKYVYLEYNKLTTLKMNKCKKLLVVNLTGHMVKKVKIDRNKKTKVYGENYYTPYSATKVKGDFANLNQCGQIDGDGTFCVYEWSADHSSCVRKTVSGSTMLSQPVALDAGAVEKSKTMQKITAQWKDAQGNFYFLADKDGDMVAKTGYYLYKVNSQGKIESELNINEQKTSILKTMDKYNMYLLNQGDGTAVFGLTNSSQNAVMQVDLSKMMVTGQAVCSFIPRSADGDVVIGADCTPAEKVYVSKMVFQKTEKLENGNEMRICELSDGHEIQIPLRHYGIDYPSDVRIYNNYVYVISGEGFFKAKLTANKFTQLYGVSKLSGMQDTQAEFTLSIKNEKEIYLMTEKKDEESVSYSLQACKIK